MKIATKYAKNMFRVLLTTSVFFSTITHLAFVRQRQQTTYIADISGPRTKMKIVTMRYDPFFELATSFSTGS